MGMCSVVSMAPLLSMGFPNASITRPSTSFPAGIVISAPVFITCAPLIIRVMEENTTQ